MKIHEYQGKDCYEIRRRRAARLVARSPEELITRRKSWALKSSQSKRRFSGRARQRRRRQTRKSAEKRVRWQQILGMKLVTHQNRPEGREVRGLLIEEGLPIDKELSGLVLDRRPKAGFMASAAGGMTLKRSQPTRRRKFSKRRLTGRSAFVPSKPENSPRARLAAGVGQSSGEVNADALLGL